MAETWVITDSAPVDEASLTLATTNISFTTNNQKATSIGIIEDNDNKVLIYGGIGDVAGFVLGTSNSFEWNNAAYKTLEFDTVPTGNLRTWLQANAVKQIKPANKVVVNGETLLDLTQDTVTPATLAKGSTAHDKSGAQITGTMEASAGGDYNIAATTNADGTQNLAITDAAGGGGSGGGSGQQLVNLTITVDPTNAPEDWNWSLFIYSSHGDSIELNADTLVSTIPGCIVGGIFAIDAAASVNLKAVKGYLDLDTITPSCVNCFFDIIGNAGGFISSNDRYPVYVCQIDPDAPAGAEATMTLKFN